VLRFASIHYMLSLLNGVGLLSAAGNVAEALNIMAKVTSCRSTFVTRLHLHDFRRILSVSVFHNFKRHCDVLRVFMTASLV
jgi:hypothetical protein